MILILIMNVRTRTALCATLTASLLLAGCATPAGSPAPATSPGTNPTTPNSPSPAPTTEVDARTPRLAVGGEGFVAVLDAATLSEIARFTTSAPFPRLNPAGDDRHLFVSEPDAFRLLDLGTWTRAHGDHGHSYVTAPRYTDITFPAAKPGHVVEHDGSTALFSDGSGTIETFTTSHLGNERPRTTTVTLPSPHHGVAIPLHGGGLVHTLGTEDARRTISVRDQSGATVASTDACPGVHGEAAAAGRTLVFGCTDGAVVLSGSTFTKVQAAVPYARSGNLAGSPKSPVMLADYKTDKDAVLERPTKINLIDTVAKRARQVELGASYSFRSLARGPKGDALVLTTDGRLTVVDAASGTVVTRIPVVGPWTEPDDWQEARPAVRVFGKLAYVTEPAKKRIHVVDLTTNQLTASGDVGFVPNEISGNRG